VRAGVERACHVLATWCSSRDRRRQGSDSPQGDTWEEKCSVVLLVIFKPQCISTWYFFAKERSGDRKMKEI